MPRRVTFLPLVVGLALLLSACGPKASEKPPTDGEGSSPKPELQEQIVGRWKGLPGPGLPQGAVEIWEFKSDGTFSVTAAGGRLPSPKTMNGKYHFIPDGRMMMEDESGRSTGGRSTVSIEGDVLTTMGSDGAVRLKRIAVAFDPDLPTKLVGRWKLVDPPHAPPGVEDIWEFRPDGGVEITATAEGKTELLSPA